jgi:hypothetical protein
MIERAGGCGRWDLLAAGDAGGVRGGVLKPGWVGGLLEAGGY